MINYSSAYTTKKEILDIAILNARIRNINNVVTREPIQTRKILITQPQYDYLYKYLVQQLLGTMRVASADLSYANNSI